MKINLLIILIFFCVTQFSYSQEDGVASLAIPVRNSLRFNRFVLNPTFSFVREQNKYISFTNKREWVQFEDAPLTYLASYSGRFRENIGIGVGLFQQNYGVLTSFGGILNFAYNARLQQESNLTFGLNLGFYKSGVNEGKVITNVPDPSLNNIPSIFLLSISPGINYGTMFFDFGLSVNNLVQYNLKSSEIIEEDPKQSVQAHIMYTGYMDSGGFFDESKFSTLVRSEFLKDQTIISGIAMLTVPKGVWGQVGYNTVYGISAGIGLNITEQIAIEYNFEKAIGDLEAFGSSHEITLAYRFKNKDNFYYSGDDEESAFVIPKKRKRVLAKSTSTAADRAKRAQAKIKADEDARIAAEKLKEIELIAKTKADEEARLAVEDEAKAKADEEARIAAEKLKEIELIAKTKADEEARLAVESEAKAKADEEARIATEKLKEIELIAKAARERIAAEEAVLLEITHKDELARAMFNMTELAKASKLKQEDLLTRLNEAIENKNEDLKDLKEENDLSEQGIYKEPKAFKSVTALNRALEALKVEVDNAISERNKNIIELEKQYNDRLKNVSDKNDATNDYYRNTIKELKDEQELSVRSKASLVSRLERIDVDLEFERNRRIKRALYDNEEDKYQKDRATLNQIKQSTDIGADRLLKEEDFDFGEERLLDNIQIVKDVKHMDEGYYVVLAVHSNVNKRDEFLTKAISAGQANVNFFYDVNSSKYFIYYEKFENIEAARKAIQLDNGKPYNSKMSIVKIEK
jgi:type IX secretion system PorP/SprF family membrane protein